MQLQETIWAENWHNRKEIGTSSVAEMVWAKTSASIGNSMSEKASIRVY